MSVDAKLYFVSQSLVAGCHLPVVFGPPYANVVGKGNVCLLLC